MAEPLQFTFYRKRLQAPFTTTVGWIFKSSDKTNCQDLHAFLARELALVGFDHPFAVYHKVPFAGAAQPPPALLTKDISPAVHVDTITGVHKILYQKLKTLLKSNRLSTYTNWRWKLFPAYQRDLDPTDQKELLTVIAKQKILKKSIASVVINTIMNLEEPLGNIDTVRSFLLSQRDASSGRPLVLGLERDPAHPSSFVVTASLALRPSLLKFLHFLPIYLVQTFGQQGQAALSEEGLFLLEDQYWDPIEQLPRSRFSDDLRADHEQDEGDIVIILDNLPGAELLDSSDRPLALPFAIDSDQLSHASFDTVGHRRTPAPRSSNPHSTAHTPPPFQVSPSLSPPEPCDQPRETGAPSTRLSYSQVASGEVPHPSGNT